MATMEELIRQRLLESGLTDKLAQYGSDPAVFYQSAPDDTASQWKHKRQYPRIEFDVDLHANPERQTSGTLAVHIICEATSAQPEEIVPLVSDALCDVFFLPAKHDAISLAWSRTENFEMQQRQDAQMLLGATVLFDIYEFPVQETSDPDPVAAMNAHAKQFTQSLVIIGGEHITGFYKPTRERPAIYFRTVESDIDEQTNTVVWMHVVLAAHFFAPGLDVRSTWIKSFIDQLAFAGEVTMRDGSPMFLLNIKGNAAHDQQTGQLRLSMRYGLLRRPLYAHTLIAMPAGGGR